MVANRWQEPLDELDSKALACLMRDGRLSWAALGAALGLSAPAASERVRRLVMRGVIRGFVALVEPEAVGLPVTAFVAVSLERTHEHRLPFLARMQALDEVQECHHVAGDDDYLLKVRCRDPRDLERLLNEIKAVPGVARTRTTVALVTSKETAAVPLPRSTLTTHRASPTPIQDSTPREGLP
jgi:Lrp/AsnC family transcriptional regulator, leucine-responsive regulatory protein